MLHFSDPVVIDSASRLEMKLAAQVRKKRWTSTHCLGRTMLMVKQLMMVTTMGAITTMAQKPTMALTMILISRMLQHLPNGKADQHGQDSSFVHYIVSFVLVKFRRLLWSYWIVNIVLLCIILLKTRFCLIVVVTDCKSCVLKRLKGIVHPPQRIASGDVTFVFIIKDLGHLTRKCIHLVI